MQCTYRLVSQVDGRLIVDNFTPDNVIPAMSVRGFEHNGPCTRKSLRPELQGQPMFTGVCGPMWGGVENGVSVIRYETTAAYRTLSA